MLKALPKIVPKFDLPSIRKPTQADEQDDDEKPEIKEEGEDEIKEEETEVKEEEESETFATRNADPKRKRDAGDSDEEEEDISTVEVKQENGLNTQLDKSLITLSSLPKSRWLNLADIDLIKVLMTKVL